MRSSRALYECDRLHRLVQLVAIGEYAEAPIEVDASFGERPACGPCNELALRAESTITRSRCFGLVPCSDSAPEPSACLDRFTQGRQLSPIRKRKKVTTVDAGAPSFARPKRRRQAKRSLVSDVALEARDCPVAAVTIYVFSRRIFNAITTERAAAGVRRIRNERVNARVGQFTKNVQCVAMNDARRRLPPNYFLERARDCVCCNRCPGAAWPRDVPSSPDARSKSSSGTRRREPVEGTSTFAQPLQSISWYPQNSRSVVIITRNRRRDHQRGASCRFTWHGRCRRARPTVDRQHIAWARRKRQRRWEQ